MLTLLNADVIARKLANGIGVTQLQLVFAPSTEYKLDKQDSKYTRYGN